MGSKERVSYKILPIILAERTEGQYYVEPFVGGFNTMDKVTGNRIANDSNVYLMALFTELQNGWIPPTQVSEESYNDIRKNKQDFPTHIVEYVGFNSYAGKFFGGYRRDRVGRRDYWKEHYNNVTKQSKKLDGILMCNVDYKDLVIPYEGSTTYGSSFDYVTFWNWVRDKVQEGHRVFVSEYKAPDDFVPLWTMDISSSLTKNTGSKKGTENLFVHESDVLL